MFDSGRSGAVCFFFFVEMTVLFYGRCDRSQVLGEVCGLTAGALCVFECLTLKASGTALHANQSFLQA